MTKDEKIEAYKAILDATGLEIKGKNNLYTSHKGHMFSFVGQEDIVAVRLSKEDQEKFVEKYKTPYPVRQYNSNMHDYVELPDALLKDTKSAAAYFRKGLDFIKTLPPK